MSDKPETRLDEDAIRKLFHLGPAQPDTPAEQDPAASALVRQMAEFRLSLTIGEARKFLDQWRKSNEQNR